MIIDGNAKEKSAMNAFRSGDRVLGHKLQDEFVAEFNEGCKTEDHCPCDSDCKYHGRCAECVAIHRAHQEHLPKCFRQIINSRIAVLSELSEHTFPEYISDKK